MLLVRAAQRDDAPAIGRVHVSAWRVGYRGIMPDDFLAALLASDRETLWRATFDGLTGDRVILVAEDEGIVVGFAGGGPALRPPERGVFELYVLNVDPPSWQHGVGSALLEAFVSWSVALVARELVLWVVRDNSRARASCPATRSG